MIKDSELQLKAAEAVEEAVASHSVGIVVRNSAGQEEMGTGIAMSFGGVPFILTANHVVKDTPDEALRFFPRPSDSLVHADRSEVVSRTNIPITDLYLSQRLEIFKRSADDDVDLAILHVSSREDIERRTTIRFYQLDPKSTTPSPGHLAITLGYPVDIARQIFKDGNYVVFTSVDWSELVDHRPYLKGYDPDRHFLKPYDMVRAEQKAHPGGFSGAGVWYRQGPTPKGQLWTPRLSLAGVVSHYYRESELLKAVRVEMVIEFLTKALR